MKAGARIFFAAIVCVCSGAIAQSGGGYDLRWNVPAAGGAAMSGAGYTLTGTVAQPVAAKSCVGGYTLNSGFWPGVQQNDVIFRNGFEAGC